MKGFNFLIFCIFPLFLACSSLPLRETDHAVLNAKDPAIFGPAFLAHFESPEEASMSDKNFGSSSRSMPAQALTEISSEITQTIDRPLSLGMTMDEVAALWGSPEGIDVAGNPRFGNQRWSYTDDFAPTPEQSQGAIYFENGRVAGWELPH